MAPGRGTRTDREPWRLSSRLALLAEMGCSLCTRVVMKRLYVIAEKMGETEKGREWY